MVELVARRGEQTITIPAWLWASVGSGMLLGVGGLGTWVGATLIDHGVRIGRVEERLNSTDNSIVRIEAGITRMDAKIDRLLEQAK